MKKKHCINPNQEEILKELSDVLNEANQKNNEIIKIDTLNETKNSINPENVFTGWPFYRREGEEIFRNFYDDKERRLKSY